MGGGISHIISSLDEMMWNIPHHYVKEKVVSLTTIECYDKKKFISEILATNDYYQ